MASEQNKVILAGAAVGALLGTLVDGTTGTIPGAALGIYAALEAHDRDVIDVDGEVR